MTTLWLFDIDGTLVNINHLHLEAHQASYREVLNLEVPAEKILPTFGMGGHEERKAVLKSVGVERDDKIEEIIRSSADHFARVLSKSKVLPLPGTVEFLTYLNKNKDNKIGIVTGNEKEPAFLILAKSKLKKYFSVCCFDDNHTKERADIVRHAIKEAKKVSKVGKVIVIGDTNHDIKAGKTVGVYTVGVATGSCSVKELKKAGADLVLSSMEEYGKILERV